MSPSELNFEVLLVFLGVRWGNLHVFQRLVEFVVVQGHFLGVVQLDAHVAIEPAGKFIAIRNSEIPLKEIYIDSEIEILPIVEFLQADFLGNALSLDKDALGYLRIFYGGLGDMEGVVGEIVIDQTLPQPVVLQRTFHH